MPLCPVLYLFYLYAPCRLLTPIRPRGRGNKYSAFDCRLSYSFDIDVVRMRLHSHVGFSCVNKHSPGITLAISLAPLWFVTSDGGKGETRQEEQSGRTMACDVACGHVHESHASGNEMTKRCKESSISLVSLDRRFPRNCWQGNIPLARSESVRRNREPLERIAAGKNIIGFLRYT